MPTPTGSKLRFERTGQEASYDREPTLVKEIGAQFDLGEIFE